MADPAKRGSIPACAGEPLGQAGGGKRLEVYPRVCGGTAILGLEIVAREGLSPRVRGNQPMPGQAQK